MSTQHNAIITYKNFTVNRHGSWDVHTFYRASSSVADDLPVETTKTILKSSRQIHPESPNDPRTVLGSPRQTMKEAAGTDKYIHSGLEQRIKRTMKTDDQTHG